MPSVLQRLHLEFTSFPTYVRFLAQDLIGDPTWRLVIPSACPRLPRRGLPWALAEHGRYLDDAACRGSVGRRY